MNWIDWLVCAVIECAQREAEARCPCLRPGDPFWSAQYDWHFSKERERWLRRLARDR